MYAIDAQCGRVHDILRYILVLQTIRHQLDYCSYNTSLLRLHDRHCASDLFADI